MKVALRRIVAPFVLMGALWLIITLVVEFSAERLLGPYQAERMTPFSNAHLLEEAFEGEYSPLADPVFLAYTVLLATLVFGATSLFAAWRATRVELYLSAIPLLAGVLLLSGPRWYFWSAAYSQDMRFAAVAQPISYLLVIAVALAFAARRPKGLVRHDG